MCLNFFMEFSLLLDRFWKDFGSLLAPIWKPKSPPGLIQAALGARGASPRAPKSLRSLPKLPKIDPEGSKSSQNGALETPRAPKMNPWTLTEPPKSAPGSNSDPSKRPEARRRPRGPQNNPQVTRKLPNRSFKSIRESGPILGLRIYQKSFKSI